MQYAGRSPYGEIYTTPTTAVDNIAKRLYAEKQQRDLQQRQDAKMLDDEFGKNLANVKSVDIPEIVSKYNKFKQAKINIQRKGAKANQDDQMEAMIAQADLSNSIGASKEDKERIKTRFTDVRVDKKGRYKPDAQKKLTQYLNTLTSERNPDADDDDLYNQYSFPDLEKVSVNMIGGKPTEIRLPTGKSSSKGDLYDDESVYQRFNHPNKMYENAFLDVSKRADRQAYERIVLDSLNEQEKKDLATRYFAKISSPEFKAIYGEVQPFPESAGATELGEAVALSVMSAVDKLPIQPLRTESKLNTEKQMDKRRKEGMEDFQIKEKIRQANRMELFGMREEAKAAGEEANELWVESYIDRLKADADRVGDIPIDAVLSKILSKDGVSPDRFGVQPNGNFIPIFYKRDKDGVLLKNKGNYVVDEFATVPMTKDQFKLVLGGKAGVKQLNKEMNKKTNNKQKGDFDDL